MLNIFSVLIYLLNLSSSHDKPSNTDVIIPILLCHLVRGHYLPDKCFVCLKSQFLLLA